MIKITWFLFSVITITAILEMANELEADAPIKDIVRTVIKWIAESAIVTILMFI